MELFFLCNKATLHVIHVSMSNNKVNILIMSNKGK